VKSAWFQNNPKLLLVLPFLGLYKQTLSSDSLYLLPVKLVANFVWICASVLPRFNETTEFFYQGKEQLSKPAAAWSRSIRTGMICFVR
jgi:hypothetical protein